MCRTARGCQCPIAGRSHRAPAVAPSPPSRRRLRLTVAGRSPAPSIRPSARSMLTSLRHPGCVRQQRRLPGTGSPSLHRSLVAQVFNLCHGAAQVENLRYRPQPLHRFSTCVCSRFGLGSQYHPSHLIPKGRAAGSGARAEDGDMCGRWAWVFRTSSEFAHAAGFEHVTGRLRIPQRRARLTGRPVLVRLALRRFGRLALGHF